MPISMTPAYNLKAVLKETGIKPDVLRAWERRYGIPLPQRTSGGHRLYSEHDIEMIKWLISRQNDGMSISRAADMWKETISRGLDPLGEARGKPAADLNLVAPPQAIFLPVETGIDTLRAQWLTACMNFNEIAAEQALNQAFAMHPVETVCLEVLQRAMTELGGLWYENRASIQQEHFASALAMRRLDALISASPAPTRPHTVIVGCPADEWHSFTPMLLALFLRRRGLNIIYLGANVPAAHFAETVESVSASLVVLAAQQLNTAATLQQSAAQLTAREISVAFGGRIFAMQPGLVKRISGHYLGDRLDAAIERVESLLTARPAIPQSLSPSAEYQQVLQVFTARRVFVESSLSQAVRARGGSTSYLAVANKFMGDNILSALQLGDITFVDSEIDWLIVLLEVQNLSRTVVHDYLELYSDVVALELGDRAAIITRWLDNHRQAGKTIPSL